MLIMNPDFMGADTAREAQEIFWCAHRFTFLGREPLSYRYSGAPKERPLLYLSQLDHFLNINIKCLDVTPKKYIRKLNVDINWNNAFAWEMPAALLDGPIHRHVTLTVARLKGRLDDMMAILILLHTMHPIYLRLRSHNIEFSVA